MSKGKAKVDSEQIVLEYMKRQNRPYNAKTVSENLHGEVKLAEVTKVLEDLTEKGDIIEKVNGKQKIYWYNQNKLPEISAETTRKLTDQRNELKEKLAEIKEKLTAVEKEHKTMSNTLSNEELQIQLKKLSEEVAQLEEKKKGFTEKKISVDPKEKEQLIKENEMLLKEWRKRKRICKDAAELLTESSGMKLSKFYETLGIETDEQVGVIIDQMVDYSPKRKFVSNSGSTSKKSVKRT